MKLTLENLKNREAWERAGISLPAYDVAALAERTKKAPVWVHMGIGNIFRIFMGGIADRLVSGGFMDKGITCVETFDFDLVDKIYRPCDNLTLSVILKNDGTRDCRVLGALTEAVKAQAPDAAALDAGRTPGAVPEAGKDPASAPGADRPASAADAGQWERTKEIFRQASLQLVSFTITEKGYALYKGDGSYFDFVKADLENGPERAKSAMAVVAAMLLARYQAGGAPLALVSMDNCSKNGENLRNSVLTVGEEWRKRGYVDEGFLAYISDENRVAFPWTMIDKITPRPSEAVAADLAALGIEGMEPVITSKKTYIAPFANGEGPQYLVVEDHFPNGRPPFEKAGVYMADRETVNRSERMKVTACLNPIHSALGPYGCLLGYELFSDEMRDPQMLALARLVGYGEGLPMAPDPGIFSPKAFLDEIINDRFPNPYLGDTTQRLSVDMSQIVGIRFGETIKAYIKRDGNAGALLGIPLAIAGWLRYLLGVDDEGRPMELAPDPMLAKLCETLSGVTLGDPESLGDKAESILSDAHIFRVNLYEAGIGERIEAMLREELAGPGAVRRTLERYLAGDSKE